MPRHVRRTCVLRAGVRRRSPRRSMAEWKNASNRPLGGSEGILVPDMKDTSFTPMQIFRAIAITVVVLWGVREFSLVLKPVVLGLILAYAFHRFPNG